MLLRSRALPLCKEGIKAVEEAGWGNPACMFARLGDGRGEESEPLNVLWVETDTGVPVGLIVFVFDEIEEHVYVELSYVSPGYRRQGIYSALYRSLVRIAQRNGFSMIVGQVDAENQPMLKAAAANGREIESCDEGVGQIVQEV